MKDRIKYIRKSLRLTQTSFGEKLGLKGNTITGYETGLRTPSDAVIVSICREFGVNEDWLRSGEGEIFAPLTRSETIAKFAGELMRESDDSFKKQLFEILAELDEEEWEILESISGKLAKKE